MANLTISVDAATLKQARIRALQENTSVNAVLGRLLDEYAHKGKVRRENQRVLRHLFETAEKHPIDRGNHIWRRDNLHDR